MMENNKIWITYPLLVNIPTGVIEWKKYMEEQVVYTHPSLCWLFFIFFKIDKCKGKGRMLPCIIFSTQPLSKPL